MFKHGKIEPYIFREYKAELFAKFTHTDEIVLDIGCGPRSYEKCCNGLYIGIDLNFRPTVMAAAENLPFRDECFGTIMAFDIIEHVTDTLSVLKECKRVLKRDGKLILIVPNTLGFGIYDSIIDRSHRHAFTWFSIRRELIRAGLRVQEMLPIHLHIFRPLKSIRSRWLMWFQQSICIRAGR